MSHMHLSSIMDTTANETTYREAINQVRLQMENASPKKVHLYSFNIPAHQMKEAITALDKEEGRGAMRVTNSPDHNFIIKYIPGAVYQEATDTWVSLLTVALVRLTTPPQSLPPGIKFIGRPTFGLAEGIVKEPDTGIRPMTSSIPTVVLEVGDSETLTQLRIDARGWLEAENMNGVRLVMILSITQPKIAIELWRAFDPVNPPRSPALARQRTARNVWQAEWTHNATPLYVLLSDIFGGQPPPPEYGNADRVNIDTALWRQYILDAWNLP